MFVGLTADYVSGLVAVAAGMALTTLALWYLTVGRLTPGLAAQRLLRSRWAQALAAVHVAAMIVLFGSSRVPW